MSEVRGGIPAPAGAGQPRARVVRHAHARPGAVHEAKAAATKIAKRDASDLDRALMVLPNLPLCIGWMGNWIRVLGRRKVGEEAGCCVCDLARGS